MTDLHLRGVVLPEGEWRELWVRDGRVTLDPVPGARTVLDGGWLLPGLVDVHCHVGLTPDGPSEDPAVWAAQARTNRDAGALLLRDAGVPVDTRGLDAVPDLPRIVRAGRHLARPRRYLPGYAEELAEVDQLPGAVARQAARGGGWVKLVGDWIDREVGDLAPLWPADVLAAAVRAAHAAGARVAVHTFGTEALPDLLAAGVDSVEHGTGLTPELVDTLAGSGAALVPTTLVIATFGDIAARATRFPAYAARLRRLARGFPAMVRAAHEAGVPIYVGTDAGGLPHGRVVAELRALAEMGLPADAVLRAGSWGARSWLGLPGIAEGAPADLVAYPADPRRDLAVLGAPSRVVLRGAVVR